MTLRLPVLMWRKTPAPLRVRLVVREGADATQRIAAVGALDLDHVRAVVGVELRGVGSGDALRQIDDADALEGRSLNLVFGVRHRRPARLLNRRRARLAGRRPHCRP